MYRKPYDDNIEDVLHRLYTLEDAVGSLLNDSEEPDEKPYMAECWGDRPELKEVSTIKELKTRVEDLESQNSDLRAQRDFWKGFTGDLLQDNCKGGY